MILINVKFRVKPEHTATFLADIDWFTTATRAEPGNLFFDWYQSPADPGEFILVEGSAQLKLPPSTMTPPNPT